MLTVMQTVDCPVDIDSGECEPQNTRLILWRGTQAANGGRL